MEEEQDPFQKMAEKHKIKKRRKGETACES